MKKLLNILGAISLIGGASSSLVACGGGSKNVPPKPITPGSAQLIVDKLKTLIDREIVVKSATAGDTDTNQALINNFREHLVYLTQSEKFPLTNEDSQKLTFIWSGGLEYTQAKEVTITATDGKSKASIVLKKVLLYRSAQNILDQIQGKTFELAWDTNTDLTAPITIERIRQSIIDDTSNDVNSQENAGRISFKYKSGISSLSYDSDTSIIAEVSSNYETDKTTVSNEIKVHIKQAKNIEIKQMIDTKEIVLSHDSVTSGSDDTSNAQIISAIQTKLVTVYNLVNIDKTKLDVQGGIPITSKSNDVVITIKVESPAPTTAVTATIKVRYANFNINTIKTAITKGLTGKKVELAFNDGINSTAAGSKIKSWLDANVPTLTSEMEAWITVQTSVSLVPGVDTTVNYIITNPNDSKDTDKVAATVVRSHPSNWTDLKTAIENLKFNFDASQLPKPNELPISMIKKEIGVKLNALTSDGSTFLYGNNFTIESPTPIAGNVPVRAEKQFLKFGLSGALPNKTTPTSVNGDMEVTVSPLVEKVYLDLYNLGILNEINNYVNDFSLQPNKDTLKETIAKAAGLTKDEGALITNVQVGQFDKTAISPTNPIPFRVATSQIANKQYRNFIIITVAQGDKTFKLATNLNYDKSNKSDFNAWITNLKNEFLTQQGMNTPEIIFSGFNNINKKISELYELKNALNYYGMTPNDAQKLNWMSLAPGEANTGNLMFDNIGNLGKKIKFNFDLGNSDVSNSLEIQVTLIPKAKDLFDVFDELTKQGVITIADGGPDTTIIGKKWGGPWDGSMKDAITSYILLQIISKIPVASTEKIYVERWADKDHEGYRFQLEIPESTFVSGNNTIIFSFKDPSFFYPTSISGLDHTLAVTLVLKV